MADLTGQKIDNGMYHLIKLLGSGAFGEVYLAKNIRTSTFVAIKILKPDPTTNQQDFMKEVRTFVRLKHPHIVPLLDFGIDGEIAFLVMEYAPNGTLRQRHLSGSILTPETVLTYIEPLASALQYAHEEGVLHRDVKPTNILLGKDNKILLSDLGTADTAHNENSLITQKNWYGTISYMAPEQIHRRPEMASDQYALGIMAYEWLCGTRPFQGNPTQIMTQHLTEAPPPLREKNPAIHPSIEKVVLKALAKKPQDRYPTIQTFAQAFKDAVRQIEEDTKKRNTQQPPSSKPATPSSRPPIIPKQVLPNPPPAPIPQVEPEAGIPIILGPPLSNRATLPLTPQEPNRVPATPPIAPKASSPVQLPPPRSSSGRVAATASSGRATTPPSRVAPPYGRASAAAGAAGTVTPRAGGPGGIPPRGTPPGNRRGNGRGLVRSSRLFLIELLLVALLLLIGTAVLAYTQPKSILGLFAQGLVSKQQSPATITITPNNQAVQDTYTLIGAKTTNPATREIAVRTITGAAQSSATPVQATGHAQHAARSATGQITFFNSLSISQQINAGQTLNIGGGVQIVTNQTAFIPAAVPPNEGPFTVQAHAIPAGRSGNIGAYTLSASTCCAAGITVTNTAAFTGGQDAVNYSFLQQSDVNNAISQSVKNVTKQDAINDLNKQLHTGELLLNAPRCTPTLQADQPIGDNGTNVNSANVSYRMNCAATVYDNLGAQNIVKNLLTQKAATTPGPGYVLINNIQTTLSQTTTQNTLSFFFTGKGVWAYQFSDAQKLSLAQAIAGKTVADAQTILKNTPGISNATININGGNTLPTGYDQISIVIQPIAGLGGGAPSSTTGSPTVTGPTVQSGTPSSNGKGGSAPPTAGGS